MIYSNKKFSDLFIWLLMKKVCKMFLLKGCNLLLLFRNMSSAHLLGYLFLYESQIIKKNYQKRNMEKVMSCFWHTSLNYFSKNNVQNLWCLCNDANSPSHSLHFGDFSFLQFRGHFLICTLLLVTNRIHKTFS